MNSLGGCMTEHIKLTPVEWEIMESIWELDGAVSVRDVMQHGFPNGEKAYTTIQTMMNILEKKGMLERKKIGLVNFYSPIRSRDDLVKEEMSSLVSRVFHGSVPSMANFLFNSEDLSLKEIEAMKAFLNKKERELKDRK